MSNISQVITLAVQTAAEGKAQVEALTGKVKTATQTAMGQIATAFVGFNGNEDAMKAEIKDGWWAFAEPRKLANKKGEVYKSANDCPIATVNDYVVFAKAGVRNVYDTANAAVEAFKASGGEGNWYNLIRDQLRAHFKDGAPLTAEAIKARLAAKKADTAKAIKRSIKNLKALHEDHGVDVDGAVQLLEQRMKALTPRPAPVVVVDNTATTPASVAPSPATVVPPQPVVSQPAAAPSSLEALIGQLVTGQQQMAQTLAAFVPAKKGSKK